MAIRRTSKKKAASGSGKSGAKMAPVTEFDLGKTLTIAQVADWHYKLAGVFDLRESIFLEGGGIEKIDSAGLQLLAALMKEAEEVGVEVRWSAVSKPLRRNADQLGLRSILKLDAS